jgi:hypothetical protein
MTVAPDFLAALPDRVADAIKAVLPDLADCRGIAGRLDTDALKRQGARAPAVLVSRLRLTQEPAFAGPVQTYTLQMAAFVLTRDVPGLLRSTSEGVITQALLALVPDSTWGAASVLGPARQVVAEPVVTTATEAAGIGLCAVTWAHIIVFAGPPEAPAIVPELYLGQAPLIGAANLDAYDRIGEDT